MQHLQYVIKEPRINEKYPLYVNEYKYKKKIAWSYLKDKRNIVILVFTCSEPLIKLYDFTIKSGHVSEVHIFMGLIVPTLNLSSFVSELEAQF